MSAASVTKLKPEGAGPPAAPKNVYQAIAAVMADITLEGIAKDRKNTQQGYQFRGIDDVYNALSPILARNGLLMLPCVLRREHTERASQKGGTLFYVTVEVEFTLVSADDGSTHVIRTFGEAMDSGDKATNKAMSAAYKYAAMQAFCIPTEGDNDPDATHHVASAEDRAMAHIKSVAFDLNLLKEAWEGNKKAWRDVLSDAAFARVKAEVERSVAAAKTSPPPPPESKAAAFDISDDDIPF